MGPTLSRTLLGTINVPILGHRACKFIAHKFSVSVSLVCVEKVSESTKERVLRRPTLLKSLSVNNFHYEIKLGYIVRKIHKILKTS